MAPEEAKRLGRYVQRIRLRKGLSQHAVANSIGVSNTTVMRLERGEFLQPKAELLSSIARSLGIPLVDLYALAGYDTSTELPTLRPYLRRKYRKLPSEALDELERFMAELGKRHGVDLHGPEPGEDE